MKPIRQNRFLRSLLQKTPLFTPLKRWHRRRELDHLYGQMLAGGTLAYDVGANLGDRTAVLRSLGARVIAFEPQPAMAEHLRTRFAGDAGVTVVEGALGPEHGTGTIALSSEHVLASMSTRWRDHVQETNRFGEAAWEEEIEIEVFTFDEMIEQHGVPAFAKIDVEGFEEEVVRGLSSPVPSLSVEFTWPEDFDATVRVLDRLDALSPNYRFNYSISETMVLALDRWLTSAELVQAMGEKLPSQAFGDVYARLDA